MTELFETRVDGVRCFWVDSGRPTLAAVLMFRFGGVDEPLTESGWQHLLEHLALHGRGGGALGVNGSVSTMFTTFEAHGPVDQVAAHLASITRWLKQPDVSDLERERNVLAAESATRGSAAQRALGWRYGARGPGVMSYDEPGLGRATADHLLDRAQRVFTTGNAALVLDGPPPPGLTLSLLEGSLLLPPAAVECKDVRPAAYVENSGLVLSGVVPRSPAATLLPAMLQRAMRAEFRDKAGSAYAPSSTYERIDGDSALVVAGSDVSHDLLPTLADSSLDLVRRLAAKGPAADHLAEELDSMYQALRDPYRQAGLAYRAATFALEEREPQTLDEMIDELRGISVDDIREVAAQFRRSMLAGIPGATAWKDQLPMLGQAVDHAPLSGRRHRHRDWPAERAQLVVNDTALQVESGEARHTYPFDKVEGLYTFPDGVRQIVSSDGWVHHVAPGDWRRGSSVVQALDQMIPSDRHLPQPPRPNPSASPRMSWARRYATASSRALTNSGGMIAAVVIMAAIVASLVAAVVFQEFQLLLPALVGLVIGLRANRGKQSS